MLLALFSCLPHFLFFNLHQILCMEANECEKIKRPGNTYHKNVVRWRVHIYIYLGRAWASPTLAWLYCARVCLYIRLSIYLWMDRPLTVNLRIYKICTCTCALQIQIWFWKWSWSSHDLPQRQWIYWVRERDCVLSERKGLLPGYSVGAKEKPARMSPALT